MKPKSNSGWCSIMPIYVRGKSASHFCIFPSTDSTCNSPSSTPVHLNVYDLTPMNGYVYWAGIGVFHTGVEVHGVEYAFGAHDYPTSGVFEVEPKQCPGFKFRRSIFIGTTCMDPGQVREFMEMHCVHYPGDTYHLVTKNCNHFCEDICYRLTGNRIPKWVNRLARIGSLCNCILPEALRTSSVQNSTILESHDNEKKRLRRFSCLSSISMHRKEKDVSISSVFLHSHYKESLSPLEPKSTRNGSVKEL